MVVSLTTCASGTESSKLFSTDGRDYYHIAWTTTDIIKFLNSQSIIRDTLAKQDCHYLTFQSSLAISSGFSFTASYEKILMLVELVNHAVVLEGVVQWSGLLIERS